MQSKRFSLLLSLALAAAGCEHTLDGRPCPCEDADGRSCWPATNRCVDGLKTQLLDQNWYTYSDRTIPNSLPPVLKEAGYTGVVDPMEGPVQPSDVGGPVIDGMARPYYRIDAGGESDWGVGFGLDFSIGEPAPDYVNPVNECDAGQVWDSGSVPKAFDASAWTGVAFYAHSFTSETVQVDVHIDDDRTSPWGQLPYDAGGCNACYSSSAQRNACSDSFSATIPVPPGEWKAFEVPFASLRPASWGDNVDAAAVIHVDNIYNLHFQVSTKSGIPVPAFSLGVAYAVLYKY